ncbi:hypothetical protein ACIQNU_43255 [Streptomyces sp. NPDC091292]|uniref:hypothetical protein n=1 Tax=Streptomyces sp. NPDC091292 TaxID=3365991 RepID=UPI003805AC07
MTFLPRTLAATVVACMAVGLSLLPQSAGAAPAPPGADKTIPKEQLPKAEAFLNGEPADLAAAVAFCNSGPDACTFAAAPDKSFRYYAPTRVVGEPVVNCTRTPIEHTRRISYAEDTYDSVNQTQKDLFARPSLARPQDTSEMAQQFAQAQQAQQRPWVWTTTNTRDIAEWIQPGEVSWVEVQPARERTYGSFTASGEDVPDWRINITVDSPSRAFPDRILQRTGPMSASEKQQCATH